MKDLIPIFIDNKLIEKKFERNFEKRFLPKMVTFELISFKQLECDEDEIIGSKVTVSHSKCFMDLELFHDKKTH